MGRCRLLFAWVFWNAVYSLTPQPKTLPKYIVRVSRTMWPYSAFEPSVLRNEHGRQWEVTLNPETYFCKTLQLEATVHIGRSSNEIVGLTLWDSRLRKAVNG